MKKVVLILILLIVSIQNYAQSYIGHLVDNYSGVHGLVLNPANVVDSPFKADINIISASAFGGSDYFGINVQDVINSDGGFDFDDDIEKFPKDDNNFFFNADILGPSFMFNLNRKSSIGITTRVRAFLNINNISGELYESLADGFDQTNDFDINMNNFNGTIHAWGEIGLTYGRILMKNEKHLLKGGVTLKYLQGAGAGFFNAPLISGQYDATANSLTTAGNLSYGLSQEDFDIDDIEYKDITSGFGADIGFTYQWNSKDNSIENDSIRVNYTQYKVKIGASITDIGSINYKQSEITQYNLNNTVDASIFDQDDTEQTLEDNYSGVTTVTSTKLKLPTAFHLLLDYRIKNKLYTSFSGSFSLVKNNTETANTIINAFTIAPRLETKWFSIYSPVSFRQYGDLAWGAGLRFGPLMVGSGSVLTNLFSDTSKTTDVYVGLKVPIYRKLNKTF
ncbi:hypothetical protein SAMN05421824_2077 [Hyunsoonleella jejuensis]|uniref:DUF5723 domain-containing protein n=1 Tax=Hyunsoonleella jejuensis TaxID=419940 RepID=A0A1H9I6E2_9FLAO|nr:DUF5723 family protein [Hyunsoonleella jejuensis]SEQ70133.1 hypothetical protein SAMN05421824_2077 [Hyunsoonleella jejuensis]